MGDCIVMKKGNLFKKLFASSLMMLGLATAAGSLAWILPYVQVDNTFNTNDNITGSTMGAYFAYGNGIPTGEGNRVYGITKPRHLYNLAWLQYLGWFDRTDSSKADYGQQFYFELANDLDMTGWVLPPIGTEEHPFIGNFEGNGHIISNLTISNNFSDFNTHPSAITGWNSTNYKQPHIIGLFGVIGNYNDKYDTSAGTCNYVTQNNELKDTGLTGITVKTTLEDSLVGMAAGYVSGVMSNVAVDSGTLNIDKAAISQATTSYGGHTSNISDYSVVGFTTNKHSIKKITDTIYDVSITTGQEFNANGQGKNEGWGGSIDMMSMFERLDNIRQNAASSVDYTYRTINDYVGPNDEGTLNPQQNSTYSEGSRYSSGSSVGNFNYLSPNSSFMYLSGGRRVINKHNLYYSHEGAPITDGTHYMNFDGTSFSSGTSSSTCNLWVFESGTSYISTSYNGTTYYLKNDSGTLSYTTSTSDRTAWTISSSASKLDIYDGNYHLTYGAGTWLLIDSSRRVITDGTNYMYCYKSGNSYYIGNTTNGSQATTFTFSTLNGSGTIRCTISGTNRYLYYNDGNLSLSNNSYNWRITNSNGELRIADNSRTYYLCCENNTWKLLDTTETPYYHVSDLGEQYYLAYSNGITTVTSATGDNIKWYYNANDRFYNYNSSNNYLGINASWWNQNYLTLTTSGYYYTMSGFTAGQDNVGYLKATYNSYDYYCYVNNGSFTYGRATAGTTISDDSVKVKITYFNPASANVSLSSPDFVISINESSSTERDGPDSHQTSIDKKNEYTSTNTTYFPLNVKSDGGSGSSSITNGDYAPTDANTGYVIAGSTLTDDNTIGNGGPSMVRVSKYSKDYTNDGTQRNISNSFKYTGSNYANGTIANSDVRTITASGNVSLTTAYSDPENQLEKYSASKTTLLNVLRSSANNYGLHFMNSQISSNDILKATNVSILGKNYGDPSDQNIKKRTYDMPVNSIDFRLKEKGYINFFAGTYFSSDVDSFFSLHQIFRDNEANGYAITEIKEIAAIYGNLSHNNWSYAYEYTDGTFLKPYRFNGAGDKFELTNAIPDPETTYAEDNALNSEDFATYTTNFGYTKLFDTEWITNYRHSDHSRITALSQSYLYYFEIPMNSGEFCLGSVYGGTGSYLLYLDIGASASKTQRTSVVEHFYREEFTFDCPDGVAVIATDSISGETPTFNENNSICVTIIAGYKGELDIVRDADDNVTVTRDTTYYNRAKPSYISDTIQSVVDPGGDMYHRTNPTDDQKDISFEVIMASGTITETYRLEYYDYQVNYDSILKTVFTDVRTKEFNETTYEWNEFGSWSRTITQQNGNNAAVTLTSEEQMTNHTIDIYKYFGNDNLNNGTLWSYSEVTNTNTSIVYNGSTNTTLATAGSSLNTVLLKLYHLADASSADQDVIDLKLDVDADITTGTYYKFDSYIFTPIVSEGTVTYIVIDINTKTIYIKTVVNSGGTAQEVLTELEDGESYEISPQYVPEP